MTGLASVYATNMLKNLFWVRCSIEQLAFTDGKMLYKQLAFIKRDDRFQIVCVCVCISK